MNEEERLPARTTIGYRNRRFSFFAEEVTTFLMACNEQGLSQLTDITGRLEQLNQLIESQQPVPAETFTPLISELIYFIKGSLYEER